MHGWMLENAHTKKDFGWDEETEEWEDEEDDEQNTIHPIRT